MSDGGETVRLLQRHLRPNGKHILDWFHITIRLTVLNQYTKGLIKVDKTKGQAIQESLASIKWKLWHGKAQEALEKAEDLTWDVSDFEDKYLKYKDLQQYLDEFCTYIEKNASKIVNYGKRWRKGKTISTAVIESLVNSFLGKRFSKKQQMQWSKAGVHLLLQLRAKVINHELGKIFKKWYPYFNLGMKFSNDRHFKVA